MQKYQWQLIIDGKPVTATVKSDGNISMHLTCTPNIFTHHRQEDMLFSFLYEGDAQIGSNPCLHVQDIELGDYITWADTATAEELEYGRLFDLEVVSRDH